MRHLLRTLASNVHILLVSLVIAGLALSVPASSTSVTTTVGGSSPKATTVNHPSTGPVTGGQAGGSNSYVPAASNASGSPLEAQNEPQPSINGLTAGDPPPSTPVATTPSANCTSCSAAAGCTDMCAPPVDPSPPPTPQTPQPPAPYCGPCGTYTGPRPSTVMCPMYCMDTTPQ